MTAFRQGLKEAGYVEGQNVKIEYRWAEGKIDRLPGLAADLIRRQVAVIAANSPSALAAKAATSTIPIVFNSGADPVRLGLVASLSRPGGNVTGVSFLSNELEAKRPGLLRELVPQANIIAALTNPIFPDAAHQLSYVQEAAQAQGRQLYVLNASTESEIDAGFATLAQQRPKNCVRLSPMLPNQQTLAGILGRALPCHNPTFHGSPGPQRSRSQSP